MKKASRTDTYRTRMQAIVAKTLCQEQAIDCGYAALAAAIEGRAWQRNRYMNLMRRFASCTRLLDAWTREEGSTKIRR